jgi:predicted transcriptional regulator
MEKKHLTSVRLSPEAKRLLAGIAKKLSISLAAVLELAIRDKAKREGVE